MTADRDCTVAARMDCLAQAMAFVEAFCAEHGVARDDGLRLALVVEELFTNTVTHGHGGNSDEPVRIGLGAGPSHIDLSYEDTAAPFDPLDHLARSASDLDADVADRPIGHVGIALALRMAMRSSYVREDGRNRLQLTLQRQA